MIPYIPPNITTNPSNLSNTNRFKSFVYYKLLKKIFLIKNQKIPENISKKSNKRLQ